MAQRRVLVSRSAEVQIRGAVEWWTENRPAAPGALTEELERALALLAEQPRIGAAARNRALEGVRRVHLSRVHYFLYYRVVDEPPSVEILALWHTSRGAPPPR